VAGGQSNPTAAEPVLIERRELFISYSHHDLRWLDRLRVHLKPLEKIYRLERWDDSRIKAGDLWRQEIEEALARAEVALLLVSPDFLASDFIDSSELPSLFQSAREKGLRILWVPLRPSIWKKHPEIAKYQAIIPANKTLAQMSEVEQDVAMVQIVEAIEDTFNQIKEQRLNLQTAAKAEKAAKIEKAAEAKAASGKLAEAEKVVKAEKAVEAELEARRKDSQWRVVEEQTLLKQEEDARLACLRAEADALAEEAERWRADYQQLQRENERLKQQAKQQAKQAGLERLQTVERSTFPAVGEPALIQIPVTRGWLVRQGNQWQTKTEKITRAGYRQELTKEIAITMLKIPAGEFQMGSSGKEADRDQSEGPQHRVHLQSFFLGQTPVTQAQWKLVAGWPKLALDLNPDPSNFKGANRPVERVSWVEAMEFCHRLSQHTELSYTLPSEAQWEYACRAGTTAPFVFGDTLTPVLANYDGNYTYGSGPNGTYRKETTDLVSFPANAWGLQDMHGNVWEWCLDHWHENYEGAPSDGSPWVNGGDEAERLLRGGSWFDLPSCCRSAFRDWWLQAGRNDDVGFRLCGFPPGLAS
jgi:formylglycine-generating enzyme required for sulfatase activity